MEHIVRTFLTMARGPEDRQPPEIRGWNFVVYANEKFASDDIDGLASFVKPGCMILITCEDESIEGGYLNRRVVFAEAKED